MISRSAEKRCVCHGTHARYVFDDVVKEREAGLETGSRRGRLPRGQIGRHDLLLRLDELLHHAEVLLHQRGARVGGSDVNSRG